MSASRHVDVEARQNAIPHLGDGKASRQRRRADGPVHGARLFAPHAGTFNTLNSQTSVIVRVQGPLVRWDRSRQADLPHAAEPCDDGSCGKHLASPSLSIYAILSRRCVRRYNVVAARAFIAVHCDDVASLLP